MGLSGDAPEQDRAFVHAALLGMPFGVAFIDTDLRVLWVNDAFGTLGGLSAAESAGRTLSDVLPSVRPAVEDQVREVLQSGRPLVNVVLAPAAPADGTPARHWRATIYPVHSNTGTLLGACCLCTDVTAVMRLEAQFLQSQKMESVGLLANVIAHDFNNLLTVIQGYCDLMLRDATDVAKRTKRLGEIRAAAEAAGHLSRQLLTLSRRNTGALGPVDLNLLVRGIGRMLDRVLPANVAHDMILAEDLGLTLADPGQLEQILMNFITNAIDAMPAGGLLTIGTANTTVAAGDASTERLAPGEYVTLTVTDTGIGMDTATQARLFEPLFSTKAPDKATGVGLSSVRTMVEQLHGGVSAVSAPAKGSTFTVHLPRAPRQGAVADALPRTPPGVRRATVLVVEDHPELRRALLTVLEEAGYAVIATGAGGEALRVASEHQGPIDLLLVDIELPDADGTELAERLRKARPGMRVLVASGFGEQTLSPDDAARRGYTIISKPFTMTELVHMIQATLYPATPVVPAPAG